MTPRARLSGWARPVMMLGAALVPFAWGWAQDEGAVSRASRAPGPCVFRSTALMPVPETRAIGYANNNRVLVDANGSAWIAMRSKRGGGQFTIGLVRVPPPWHAGMDARVTWIEDRDSLQFSAVPQRVAAIAAGPDGAIHMAWYGGIGGATDHQIRYARFTPGSSTTQIDEERAPFRVPGFDAVAANAAVPIELWQEHASIAVGPDGTVHLAWEARDPFRRSSDGLPRPGIAYATRSRDGVWSVNGVLDRPPYLQLDDRSPSQSRPSILVDRNGLVHVLCYGSVGGAQQVLHGTTAGRGFSGWKVIAPSPGDQRHAAAALDAQGRLHVAWREGVAGGGSGAGMAIFFSVRETDGRWHPPTRLTGGDENASTPSVGVTDSSVCVAWVAWNPGAVNSDGQVDNGFPADNSTVEGRVEITSSPLGRDRFEKPRVLDPGPASYPCWAMGPVSGAVRPALAWTSIDATQRVNLKFGWCDPGH